MTDAIAAHEIITDEAGFCSLQTEWNELWELARGRHYQSFTNCWIAWEKIAKPLGRRLQIIVRRESGKAIMILPVVTYRRMLWTFLLPLSTESADLTTVLVEDSARTAALVEDAWKVVRSGCGADFIHMPYVPDSTDLHRLVLQERRFVICKHSPHYFANISAEANRYDWKGFCDSL